MNFDILRDAGCFIEVSPEKAFTINIKAIFCGSVIG